MRIKAVWGIVDVQGSFLFVKRSANTSRPGQWCLPGGGIKRGESPDAACIREVGEEAGLDVDIVRLVVEDDIHAFFLCQLRSPDQSVVLQKEECSDYRWCPPDMILSVGELMDFQRLQRVFTCLGLDLSGV